MKNPCSYLENLNESQHRAVTAPLKPILVLAGPGTGKTRTLVARILYLIRHHEIPPHKILAVTFTNKAKEEMKHRLQQELGDAASDLKVGTFHRFCMTVLREHHDKAGLPKEFAIADETAQLLTLGRVTRIQDAKSLSTVLSAISSYRLNKDNLNPNFQGIAEKWLAPYQQELRKNRLIDFDQILLLAQQLFLTYPELVTTYQQAFDAILVDEFQDTDPIQYTIMKFLAWQHRNLFVVADDDQSIFAWRGAHIENIDQYVRDFECPNEQIIILHDNYRSAQSIIEVATRLINCGPRFKKKQIQAVGIEPEEPVVPQFLSFGDDEAEMEFIIEQIKTLAQPPLRYSDVAILYPTHAIGEQLEAQLLAARIPCQLIKRQGIFDQEVVRKLLLLLKLLQNPHDDLALEQFFQLELHHDLAYEQIRALKDKQQSFKQTLYRVLAGYEISAISHSALHRTISATFGMISNMLSWLDQHPDVQLPELINMLCNLTAPSQTVTIHTIVHQLCDPLDIPGIQEAVTTLRETASCGGKISVCGEDPLLVNICQALVDKTDTTSGPVVGTTSQVTSTSSTVGTTSQVTSTSSTVGITSQVASTSNVFLCLDHPSLEKLRSTYPDLPDSRIILLTTDQQTESASCLTILSPFSAVTTVFKLLQAFTSAKIPRAFSNYVVFDLETTSNDIRTTRIVEIGAVKVRNGEIVEKFSALLNPEQPITRGAYNVHHISEEEVRDKQTFAESLPEFMDFIGDDMLVAHNGLSFDFPIMMRLYKEATGKTFSNRRFDTLPLARKLFPGQPASVDALMKRFGIEDVGGRHRALDDTVYLAQIFERLQDVERSINRRSEHEDLLELAALGVFFEVGSRQSAVGSSQFAEGSPQSAPSTQHPAPSTQHPAPSTQHPAPSTQHPAPSTQHPAPDTEEQLLFQLGARKLLSRFSELPEQFRELYAQHQLDIEHLLADLCADESDDATSRLDLVFSGREVAISHLKDLAETFKDKPIWEAIQDFLDHAALYNSQDDIRDVNAVNLLTIHSAKGLEFPVVFVSGVEKGNLPSFYSVREEGELGEKKLNEQRRLFYVAMTRAKQRLMVTYVDKRGEFPKKRSQFLVELGVEAEETETGNDRKM